MLSFGMAEMSKAIVKLNRSVGGGSDRATSSTHESKKKRPQVVFDSCVDELELNLGTRAAGSCPWQGREHHHNVVALGSGQPA